MSKFKTYPKSQPVEEKQPVKKKPRPKKFFAQWLFVGLGLTGVALVSATAGALLAVSLSTTPLRQAKLSPQEQAVFNQDETVAYKNLHLPELSRPVNILILGTKVLTSDLDNPPENQKDLGYQALVNSFHGLTDTMLLLRFEPTQEKLAVLSIPRDTQTLIEGHGLKKINEANYYGGPALTAQTVSNLLDGVPIDRYVRVNIQGVEKLIDALGGVTVYVPKDMKYRDDSQHFYVNLKKGEQHLNGEQAAQFLRFRYDEYGDIGRIQRQQMLLRALIEQALKPQTLLKIPDIVSVIQSNIDTNLSVEELVALAGFAGQTQRSKIQMLMLPGGFSGDGKKEVSYWIPYERQIKTMVAQYFDHGYNEEQPVVNDPTSLRIAIQDSTGDPEAVQAMVRYLQEKGFRRIYVSEQWPEPLTVTRIVAQKGDDSGAAQLRANLGVGEVLVESTGNLASDVTIQLGKDWQQKHSKETQASQL
ncbi:LCP family protein [Gloeothece verrucosa]|uniref:Cell envelope-related transcriptional attenuator n=1 Tax=Gloeothece verrucosa (strain PCC 7822) TaxID=497965 RepID=E0UAT9_GLOV7|nr:LCP family protein [Gloeothece verrucosa]ADN15061.1 cell envelope-related transcriptional attenuator [Gloeothece verrucosa PCC 7822]